MIVIREEKNKLKFYWNVDILFNEVCWQETEEEFFNSCVVKFRDSYKMKYGKNINERIFYNTENGLPEFKVIRY